MEKIRWGIISTGNIAGRFADGLRNLPDAELVAVASRNQENADDFGDRYDVPRRYPTYEALAADPDIDAVYIGTPHVFHRENALLCLENDKAVLLEKPFAMNATEAADIIRVARERGIFIMEAMWTRFLPAIARIRELLKSGVLGQIELFQADFGFRPPYDPEGRLYNPKLGGGALLDIGIYPVSFAWMIFGKPQKMVSTVHIGGTGVDEASSIIFDYGGGRMAAVSISMLAKSPTRAIIVGTEGRIEIPGRFFVPQEFTLTLHEKEPARIALPMDGNGYAHEAAEVARCLRAGKTESDIMPLDETLAIMQTLDEIRAQWGLRYPADDA